MKQLTYIKKNTLEWWDVKEPVLQFASDAIVRPFAAARCDGDKVFLFNDITSLMQIGVALHYLDPITIDVLGKKPFKGPIPVGHECIAEIVSCGDEVKKFKVGDKVIVPWAISCGSCFLCKSGLTSKCSKAGDTYLSGYGFGEAMGPWGGMISDRFRVPFADNMLVSVPDGVDPISLASASDNIPDGWRTVAPFLKEKPEAPVLIVGGAAASIGLYAAATAVALGSPKVDYVDYGVARLEIAASLGANPIQIPARRRVTWYRKNAPRRNGDYPITVDASANREGLNFAIRSLAPGGICTSVGYYFQKGTSIPLMQMYANSSTLHTGISHPRADLPEVVELIKSKKFQPEKITTVLAKWDDAAEAFLERTTKVVVHRPALS
jgi:threonine dehydrogenase-like Zn-dependent dehydrogenase